jgi:hypothetical protein
VAKLQYTVFADTMYKENDDLAEGTINLFRVQMKCSRCSSYYGHCLVNLKHILPVRPGGQARLVEGRMVKSVTTEMASCSIRF